MRIAIAHGSREEAETLERLVTSHPGYEISWIAGSGMEAVEKAERDIPDLLLMDLNLPGLSGAGTTAAIMKDHPCAILIVVRSAKESAAQVFEAMGNGALDVVNAPGRSGDGAPVEELLKKLAIIEKLVKREEGKAGGPWRTHGRSSGRSPLVAIGSSTGGPKALAEVLSRLPDKLGAPVVVVQHLDAQFAGGLAEWLDGQTGLKVMLAGDGMGLAPDTVFVAGTNDHLILGPGRVFHYVVEPKEYPFRPSVDRFFLSARDCWPEKGVAALLTGMGKDGAKGLLALREAGWHTIAQDEPTSVVYGMPKAAADIGGATEVLPVDKIADAIAAHIRTKEGLRIHDHKE